MSCSCCRCTCSRDAAVATAAVFATAALADDHAHTAGSGDREQSYSPPLTVDKSSVCGAAVGATMQRGRQEQQESPLLIVKVYHTCMYVSHVHVCITRTCVYHTCMSASHMQQQQQQQQQLVAAVAVALVAASAIAAARRSSQQQQ